MEVDAYRATTYFAIDGIKKKNNHILREPQFLSKHKG